MSEQEKTAAQVGASPERMEVRAYLEAVAAGNGCTLEAYIDRYDRIDPEYANELRRLVGLSGDNEKGAENAYY